MTDRTRNRDVILFPDKESLSHDAGERFAELASQKIAAGQAFNVALAGGSTPEMLYEMLVSPPFQATIPDWSLIHLFFGDERCVPADSPNSNYGMAIQAFGSASASERRSMHPAQSLPLPTNIHRIPVDDTDCASAAERYESTIRSHFHLGPGELPRFDLILLGMGPDGHCASLFPHKPALRVKDRLAVCTDPGREPMVPRVTLTMPVLNNAVNILFLVAGEDKAETLARVLTGPRDADNLPSQSVLPKHGTVTWLVDRSAASRLGPAR